MYFLWLSFVMRDKKGKESKFYFWTYKTNIFDEQNKHLHFTDVYSSSGFDSVYIETFINFTACQYLFIAIAALLKSSKLWESLFYVSRSLSTPWVYISYNGTSASQYIFHEASCLEVICTNTGLLCLERKAEDWLSLMEKKRIPKEGRTPPFLLWMDICSTTHLYWLDFVSF